MASRLELAYTRRGLRTYYQKSVCENAPSSCAAGSWSFSVYIGFWKISSRWVSAQQAKKRQRTAALQDASQVRQRGMVRSILEGGCPETVSKLILGHTNEPR